MSRSCYITAECKGDTLDVDFPRAVWDGTDAILNGFSGRKECGQLPLSRFYDVYALFCVLSALRPASHANDMPANELLGKRPGYYRLDRSSMEEPNLPHDIDTMCALSWWVRRFSKNATSWTGDEPLDTTDLDSEFFDQVDEALEGLEKIAEWLRDGKDVSINYYTGR